METWRYFYHPDHLGSTSWVTDSAKNGVQYCEYLPYGEPLVDQRSTTWNSRYTFSGKERDSETGYSYFGARYYHPDLSIWLSVDPMAEERPSLSPYNYCQNNPIGRKDPTGLLDEFDFNSNTDITRYRNTKGELLYETKDGLNVDIIVPDASVPTLKKELQKAKDNGTIDNIKTNQQKMHVLGDTPEEYSEKAIKGTSDYWAIGYKETYEKAYKEGKNQFSLDQIVSGIIAAIGRENNDTSAEMRHGGRSAGILEGNSDRKAGRINRLNPRSSFKNNQPIIILK